MVIYTAKLTRKKLAIGIGALGAILIAVILALSLGGGSAEASATDEPSPKGIRTAEDRVGFLAAYGWNALIDTEESQEVVIPREFDNFFKEYNELQKSQGFDLEKNKGDRVTRYIYLIDNHPSGKEPVYASLLIRRNRVIGGDLQNPTADGFIHGFNQNIVEN